MVLILCSKYLISAILSSIFTIFSHLDIISISYVFMEIINALTQFYPNMIGGMPMFSGGGGELSNVSITDTKSQTPIHYYSESANSNNALTGSNSPTPTGPSTPNASSSSGGFKSAVTKS